MSVIAKHPRTYTIAYLFKFLQKDLLGSHKSLDLDTASFMCFKVILASSAVLFRHWYPMTFSDLFTYPLVLEFPTNFHQKQLFPL